MSQTGAPIRLGLRANWQQFTLLVIINAFVGGTVRLERAVLPLLAEHDFLLTSRTAVLSFIVTFGATKALANLFAGQMSDQIGRKQILVAGWIVGLPVPLLIMLAPSWGWIVAANVLLGIKPGAVLVHDGDHEDRPGRASSARHGHGPQRIRGLCRGLVGGARLRLPGGNLRVAPAALLPRRRLRHGGAAAVRVCSSATREGTRGPRQSSYGAREPRHTPPSGMSFRS